LLYTIRSIGTRQSRRHRALWSVIFSSRFFHFVSVFGFIFFSVSSISDLDPLGYLLRPDLSKISVISPSHLHRQSSRQDSADRSDHRGTGHVRCWVRDLVVFCDQRARFCNGHALPIFISRRSATRALDHHPIHTTWHCSLGNLRTNFRSYRARVHGANPTTRLVNPFSPPTGVYGFHLRSHTWFRRFSSTLAMLLHLDASR